LTCVILACTVIAKPRVLPARPLNVPIFNKLTTLCAGREISL
jgi:hypothetical protein